ncbi:outer membrane protein transport protein [Pseudomonas sp. MWU16-30317]|uniref:OmpP1/FadL family transporter n=1 Tax=Pseudomonas sp. MWU16-30317 TaxID=2878095 RepID=UPI001CFA5C7B|nr:outer membrane protein transport protein [Pseudomonas sp. MWU16-30317]
MKKAMIKTSLSLAVTLASTQLFASGFALNEQSISGMGVGFAGRSSSADDASTVYGNPAGMSRLKREQITVGAAAVIAKTDISGSSTTNTGSNNGDMVPVVGVPMGYYVKPIDDHWTVGFGVYAPFGLKTEYENGFQGRYFAHDSKVQVVTLQPTVSYAFNDKVSIGGGPTFNRIDGTLTSALRNPLGGADGKASIKGDDTAVGYNIGILVQATDKTRLGLVYHSMVDYKLKGSTKVSLGALNPLLGSRDYDASLNIKTPESIDASFTHELTDQWTLYGGSTWTRWSRLKDITVNNTGNLGVIGAGQFGTISEQENWHDTWSHAVGASYKVNKQWTLRTGFSVDQSPTNNTDRSPRIPTGDRMAVSFGAGWSPTDDVTIDLAYSYLKEEAVTVDQSNPRKGTYDARYRNSAHGLGAGLTYRF